MFSSVLFKKGMACMFLIDPDNSLYAVKDILDTYRSL
uniref:Uncharacterized protein n=1 Tax=Anguilla anguilla TaxID=7936 RepID=A0A0E9XRC7_ANGAN